jgi:hypothetical protein
LGLSKRVRGVILSEAKNLIFSLNQEILRRFAPQNDIKMGLLDSQLTTFAKNQSNNFESDA